jgi:hypothetical protein
MVVSNFATNVFEILIFQHSSYTFKNDWKRGLQGENEAKRPRIVSVNIDFRNQRPRIDQTDLVS